LKFDVPLQASELSQAQSHARAMAAAGADGLFTFEGPSDAFAPLVLAAATQQPFDLYTNVAIAFPRSPVHLAHIAYDLQKLSGGRFILGLGSQIRAHVEYRYGSAFSSPALRMREWIEATKAIFAAWQDGVPLDFRGRFTTHTLMPPTFNPGPNPFGPAPILLGAVGPRMTDVATAVADGIILHPLNSRRTIAEHNLPQIERGLAGSGRGRREFQVIAGAIVGVWHDQDSKSQVEQALRTMLGFYASTPAYKLMLDIEGYGDLQPELRRLTKEGRWADMPALVDETMLDLFTCRGTAIEVGKALAAKFAGQVDRIALSPQGQLSPDDLRVLIAAARDS
jgi:probable F420-dependent oxidoreductase